MEAGIKTITSPQICCRTTLWKVCVQLYSFIQHSSFTSKWCKDV